MRALAYRVVLVAGIAVAPIWLLIAMLIAGAPDFWRDYWHELRDAYRGAPKAFRRGGRL